MTPPPAPRPPSKAPISDAARHYARLFIVLMVLAWIVAALPFPLRFGLIFAAGAAGAAGIMALIEAFKTPGTGTLRGLLIVGGVFAAFLGLEGVGYLLIAPEQLAYEDCMRTAITQQREDQCRADYRQGVHDRYGFDLP